MRVKTLPRKKVEVTTPNGAKLLFIDDKLRAAYKDGNLYTNFNDPDRRTPTVSDAVNRWGAGYGFSGGGERTEGEILQIAMQPVSVNYGDYTPGQGRKRK